MADPKNTNCGRRIVPRRPAALSDYTEEMVVGREARKLLAADIQSVMNEKLEELEGFGGIEEVMFTSYVMQ